MRNDEPIDPLDHQGLVGSIAAKFAGRGVETADLMSAGQIGLLRACQKFDRSRGYQFSTFASYCIRHAIIAELRVSSTAIRIPADHWRLLAADSDRMSAHKAALVARSRSIVAATMGQRDGDALGLIPGRTEPVADPELPGKVERLLDCLTPRERQVVEARFGLGEYSGRTLTLAEVGRQLGICKERVRQLQTTALNRMREHAEQPARAAS